MFKLNAKCDSHSPPVAEVRGLGPFTFMGVALTEMLSVKNAADLFFPLVPLFNPFAHPPIFS